MGRSDTALRVLLSHTSDFEDRPERGKSFMDAALRALDRAEAIVSDMSLLPASARSPMQVSESLANNADLYVGIIGFRYGSPVREAPELSYTQLEFRTAGEVGVPRLVFMLRETDLPTDAGDPYRNRQLAFREEIQESGTTIQQFESSDELAMLLYQSVTKAPGWDSALLQIFLSAVRDACSAPSVLGGPRSVEVPLGAHCSASSKIVDPLAQANDADRLVVLGGPGAGKSWLARKTAASAAEAGLKRLRERAPLASIEVPLFVPIPPFFARLAERPSVWEAFVEQAIAELEPYLPNRRSLARLRRVLEPGADRYFLVLEGLDEAPELPGISTKKVFDALLHDSSRIMVTCRPSHWHGQLEIKASAKDSRQLILDLLPLEPEHVRQLVTGQNAESDFANETVKQLAHHPSLAEAARVPLIAQLLRIAGPATTLREVYDKSINRLLRGEWREAEPSATLGPYRHARALLDAWAWSAAQVQNDPLSGLAVWKDEIDGTLSSPDTIMCNAVNNICPIVHQDVERLIEHRRFLHRTIRERLVAEHVAKLSVDEAVTVLEPHLWYDGHWQEVIPAAIAGHREPRKLLRRLLADNVKDSAAALVAFRARDGLGELRDMLVRLRHEASESFWVGDVVLESIFRDLPKQAPSPTLEPDPVEDRERLISGLRAGELPYGDFVMKIRDARLLATERGDLAAAIAHRLVRDRPTSDSGRSLYRQSLARALAALEPDETTLAKTRQRLIERFPKDVLPEDMLDAILALRPNEGELMMIVPQALVALNGLRYAWSSVQMTASLIRLKLDGEQTREIRDALLARIADESTASWLASLIESLGSTEPGHGDIIRCLSLVMRSKTYNEFDSHDRKHTDQALDKLISRSGDPDRLLSELIVSLQARSVNPREVEIVAAIATRASSQGRNCAAELVTQAVLDVEGWTFQGLRIVRVLEVSVELQRKIVSRLLTMIREPGAFWGSIGEAIAWLDASPEQRGEAAAHLLSTLASTTDLGAQLNAARILNSLGPDSSQRAEALAILREAVGTVDATHFGELIAALGTFGADGRLFESDLLSILDQLDRLAGKFLGSSWTGNIVERGRFGSELRQRLIAKTLLPAGRLHDLGFHSWNDRLIDAVTLAGSDQTARALLAPACNDGLRTALEAAVTDSPLVNLWDIECLLKHFSQTRITSDEARMAAELSGALLIQLLSDDISNVGLLMKWWSALQPSPDLVCDVCRALLGPLPDERSARGRSKRIHLALELDLAPEQARKIATVLVDELAAGNESIDSSMIGRVAISPQDLHRLIHSGRATRAVVRAAALSVRRSVTFPLWKELLPEFVAFDNDQQLL